MNLLKSVLAVSAREMKILVALVAHVENTFCQLWVDDKQLRSSVLTDFADSSLDRCMEHLSRVVSSNQGVEAVLIEADLLNDNHMVAATLVAVEVRNTDSEVKLGELSRHGVTEVLVARGRPSTIKLLLSSVEQAWRKPPVKLAARLYHASTRRQIKVTGLDKIIYICVLPSLHIEAILHEEEAAVISLLLYIRVREDVVRRAVERPLQVFESLRP